MTVPTDHLRQLATAATPGPWRVTRSKYPVDGEYDFSIDADGALVLAETFGRAARGERLPADANAAFIAAANPQTILALLDTIDAERARADKLLAERDSSLLVTRRERVIEQELIDLEQSIVECRTHQDFMTVQKTVLATRTAQSWEI